MRRFHISRSLRVVRTLALPLLALLFAGGMAPASLAAHASAGANLAPSQVSLGPIHAMPIRGHAGAGSATISPSNLVYHGGPVERPIPIT